MIKIVSPQDCCGCYACVQRCPEQCISMHDDAEGFFYPQVDPGRCTDCGLCEKVCPVIHPLAAGKPEEVYAVKNRDEQVRLQSASGGIFTLLAERVIAENGVVYGARFDENWNVVHAAAETVQEIAAFRGSKYVQSRIGQTFKEAERQLKAGRKVLFSGTPCQIAGLNRFLRRGYENLLTVDFVCHGVPSPGVWKKYLQEQVSGIGTERLAQIDFRDKRLGWKNFSFTLQTCPDADNAERRVLLTEPLTKNAYIKGFLRNYYLRPTCYGCPAKPFRSGSDMTIGDYWGIRKVVPEMDDDKGVSLVIIHTEKGERIYDTLSVEAVKTLYQAALKPNSSLEHSVTVPAERGLFFGEWQTKNISALVGELTRESQTARLKNRLYLYSYALSEKLGLTTILKTITGRRS